ncbi:hypothetical protein CABS01_08022 [Colletotrichum abscissum]|uniref:Uncharacterized protein n=1 Tax=Colletotrichum abscissum TaxID=1671311 RepID=A0A9P9X3I2_9PEZI|nr:uncharacterized protein CABS01_08022 [Colletotrichum abscissum]KAI3534161.1 hypothetical protein CABS02_13359 [Colletotrichum abscissum]KAK1508792.1 hypothetical protein CABS01_08022 [Colletotrichum abscissum]
MPPSPFLSLTGSAHPPTLFLARTFDRRWAGLPSSGTSHPLTIDDPSKPAYSIAFTRPRQPCTLHSAALFAISNCRAWMPSLPHLTQSQEPGAPSSGGTPSPNVAPCSVLPADHTSQSLHSSAPVDSVPDPAPQRCQSTFSKPQGATMDPTMGIPA